MSLKQLSAFYVLLLQWQRVSSQTVTLSVSESAPAHVSAPIDPSFPGFAFEAASFYDYSIDADGNPNSFSHNLITSVLNRTGGTPLIRVGGTSCDFAHYDASQSFPLTYPASKDGPATGPNYQTVGPSYFEAFANFPTAEYTFMVPLVHQNTSNTVEYAKQGLNHIGGRLRALEIGNEPNLYSWYSLSAYVDEYNTFVDALNDISQLGGNVIYQALDTSSASKSDLTVENAINAGINKSKQVKQYAHHYYAGNDKLDGLSGLQERVANHTAIANGISAFSSGIDYLKQNFPSAPYILSEVGNTLGQASSKQQNNVATALWNIDFQLYSMSVGVSKVNMQNIVQTGYNMWEPVKSVWGEPQVNPNFYSQPFVADFIGLHQSTTVAEISIPNNDDLSAYAAYVDGKLARIAIVNFHLWDGTGDRPSRDFTIKGLSNSYVSATMDRLTSPQGTYVTSDLTYGGSHWTYDNNGEEAHVTDDTTTSSIEDGEMTVSVDSTTAVLIRLG